MRLSKRILIFSSLLLSPLVTLARTPPELTQEGSPEKIRSVISAMKKLENQETDPEKKLKLRVNSIRLEIGLAQKLRLNDQKKENQKRIDKIFTSAEVRATVVERSVQDNSVLSKRYLYQVHFLRGVARYYTGKIADALKDFDQYLASERSMKDPERSWVLQVAAEESFEAENFLRAEQLYRELISERSTAQEFYRYKLAWALINQEKMAPAEKLLAQLAVRADDESLRKDAVKDLAFVATRTRSEDEILQFHAKLFPSQGGKPSEKGLLFLETALATLENLGKLKKESPLRNKLLSQHTDPERRFKIKVEAVLGLVREYASKAHVVSVIELFVEDPVRSSKSEALELASQKAIRSFSETYAERVKTPESIEKKELAQILIELSEAHLKMYPKTKVQAQVYQVWVEVCQSEEQWPCVAEVSRRILAIESLKDLHSKARVSQVIALEKLLSTSGNAQVKSRLLDVLENVSSDVASDSVFVEKSLVRAAELYSESKEYKRAIELLEKAFKLSASPSHELWYRLQWTRLQAQELEKLVASDPPKNEAQFTGKRDQKLDEVLATAHLSLADRAKKERDFARFETHVRRFLSYRPSPDAAALVRIEWVVFALELQGLDRAVQLHLEFSPDWQSRPDVLKQREYLLTESFKLNQFENSYRIASSWPSNTPPKSAVEAAVFSKLMVFGISKLSPEDLSALDSKNRLHWLSSLTLSHPTWVLEYLNQNSRGTTDPAEIEILQRFYLTASRLKRGQWTFVPSEAEKKAIGKRGVDLLNIPSGAHPLELVLAKVSFPDLDIFKKLSDAKAGAILKNLIGVVRKNREKVGSAVKTASLQQKVRLVSIQKEHEQRLSEMILGASVPAGLTEEQVKEYQAGLGDLAKEYSEQATELERVRVALQSQDDARQKVEDSKTLPEVQNATAFAPAGWDVNGSIYDGIRDLRRSKNIAGALIELDRLKSLKKIQTDEEYFRARTTLLLELRSDSVMRRYLFDELQDPSAQIILSEWKKTKSEVSNASEQ